MTKPIIIGVTQRVDFIEPYNETRDSLDENLINWLKGVDCIPVPIPNTLINISANDKVPDFSQLNRWIRSIGIQGFVLSGGNDIGDCVYRDETERYLLDLAKRESLPVLGLCRGMQMMGTWAGGKLVESPSHVGVRHTLHSASSAKEWKRSVNSFHNFSFKICPDEFSVLAKSTDGCLEAMRHNVLPWEAWMWHPERDKVFSEFDYQRIQSLFDI